MRILVSILALCIASPIVPALAQEGSPVAGAPEEPVTAGAAGWPLAYIERPLTLVAHMLEIQVAVGLSLAEGDVLDPVAIMPGVYYGVTDQLTLGVTTNVYPFLGLLRGICIGDNCGTAFRGLSLDGLYGFLDRGGLRLAAHGGLDIFVVETFDPVQGDIDTEARLALRVGAKLRYTVDRFAIESDPSISIGSDVTLVIPIIPEVQLTPQVMLALPLTLQVGDDASVGIGVEALFALNPQLDLWALFSFPNLDFTELRTLTFGIAYRMGT